MQTHSTSNLCNAIGYLLNELINLPQNEKDTSKFSVQTPPQISIQNYITRLNSYLNCSEQCFILGIIYLDRIT